MSLPAYLLDLNVILDYLQNRPPHAQAAESLFVAAKFSKVALWASGDAFSTLFYVLEREFRQQKRPDSSALAQSKIQGLLKRIAVAPVTKSVLDTAIAYEMDDFEDAIQAVAAVEAGVTTLVTRDANGYDDFPPNALAVLTPAQALALL